MIVIRIIYLILLLWSIFLFKKVSRPFQWVTVMIWVTVVCEAYAFTLKMMRLPNTIGTHFYSIALVPIFYLIYNSFLKNISGWIWMRFIYLIVFIFCIINSLYVQSPGIIPSYNLNALSLLVITSALLFFLNMLKEPVSSPILRQSKFWMNTAVLFYHASSFVIISLMNHFHSNNFSLSYLKYTNIVMCCIYYPVLGMSLWLNSKERLND